jgi:hypothetical protein
MQNEATSHCERIIHFQQMMNGGSAPQGATAVHSKVLPDSEQLRACAVDRILISAGACSCHAKKMSQYASVGPGVNSPNPPCTAH